MKLYSATIRQLEESADATKTAVLEALVNEGLVGKSEAESWCETHTIILRDKTLFQTLTNRWRKEKPSETPRIIVVKRVEPIEEEVNNEDSIST